MSLHALFAGCDASLKAQNVPTTIRSTSVLSDGKLSDVESQKLESGVMFSDRERMYHPRLFLL